jgi:hypothetical protein
MTATAQLLFQRIQRPNGSVLASVDPGVVAFRAVSVVQALAVGAITGQRSVGAWHQQDH